MDVMDVIITRICWLVLEFFSLAFGPIWECITSSNRCQMLASSKGAGKMHRGSPVIPTKSDRVPTRYSLSHKTKSSLLSSLFYSQKGKYVVSVYV